VRRPAALLAAVIATLLLLSPRTLADNSAVVANTAPSQAWKAISLGTFADAHALIDELDTAHIVIGELADQALHRPGFTVAKGKSVVALAVLTPAQLGVGQNGASRSEIFARARRLGFDLCPSEAAAVLRLQYTNQRVGEFLDIAMEPIVTYAGDRVSLTVGNGGEGLILIGYVARPDEIVPASRKLVFAWPLRVAQPAAR
jgi:hypothetical protein